MADDKTKKDFRDRSRVSASEDYELDYVAQKYNVSRQQVVAAIEAVGNSREEVERYLQSNAQ